MRQDVKKELLVIVLGLSLLTSVLGYAKEVNAQAAVTFIDLDPAIDAAGFADDTPFGIECGDPDFVYITIHDQGLLAKIANDDKEQITIIDDPDTDTIPAQNFFSITRAPTTGNFFILEENNGKVWQFEPTRTGDEAWTRIPIIERVVDTLTDGEDNVVYPDTFEVRPSRVKVNNVEKIFTVAGLGGLVFTEGSVWAGIQYNADFAAAEEEDTGGDISFVGLAKIDAGTLSVKRIAIASATNINGLAVDSVDSNILWITDLPGSHVFKFNVFTENVEKTINLAAGSRPLGLDTDTDNVFVALNAKPGLFDPATTSKIARISKSTLTVEETIDTTAPVAFPGLGTFTVFVNGGLLVWTDGALDGGQSHVGTVDLDTGDKSFQKTSDTNSNRFGCVPVDGEFWFAGKGSAKVGILPNSKFSVGRPVRPSGGGCVVAFTNDRRQYGPCVILDTTPPKIVRAFVTPDDSICVEARDDVQVLKVTYNGREISRREGSNGLFCLGEGLSPVIKVVAEDAAGNKSEMVAIDAKQIITTKTEQSFSAVIEKELNPHHGVEGITLTAKNPMNQIRLVKSTDFSDRELRLSDKAVMKLDGEHTVTVVYKGVYGEERYGQIYVFATNMGKIATFDVVVKDDIRLYPHPEKEKRAMYDLDLHSLSIIDKMPLNTWQRVELERIFAGNDELTIVQKNILGMVSRLAEDLARNSIDIAVINADQGFSIATADELNPHQGIEGIVLETNSTVKQIRIVSPDFSSRELYISEKGIKELDGKQIIEIVYKGQYSGTLYGKERYGQIYVFATNMGKIATFDVVVKDDMKLYLLQDGS